jgi:DNA (cytosine-5)-methyltransferase 1
MAQPIPYKPSFIDLFAGCGGMALGFCWEQFRPVDAVEWDSDAAETYRLNIDPKIRVDDIVNVRAVPRADVVVGGPPCQGFSQLGPRDPRDPRNRLWREYVRVLDESGASMFVMENVPQLLRSSQFLLFRDEAVRRGFIVSSKILCAADYGVPQLRHRAIVVGSRFSQPNLPEPSHGPKSHHGTPYVTVHDAFAVEPALSKEPDGRNWHLSRPGIRASSIVRYRAVPANGGNRFQMQANLDREGLGDLVPACWRRKPTGTTDVFGRLWWDRPALTVRTEFFKPEKGRYLHPEEDRPITVREAARLQSFPDSFRFPEHQSMVSVAKQVGNAVPPKLAREIARAVRQHLADNSIGTSPPEHIAARQLVLVS